MSLKDFINGDLENTLDLRRSSKCSICTNDKLAEDVKQYAEGKQDGTISYTVHGIWSRYFGPVYGMGASGTLRHHIRFHLGIEI